MLKALLRPAALLAAASVLLWLAVVPPEVFAQDPDRTRRPTRAPRCQLVIATGAGNFGKMHSKPMVFSGTVGRTDFGPDDREGGDGTFTAANINGDAPCNWSAETNQFWLSIGKSRGTVAAHDADEDVRIYINDRVRELQKTGTYHGIIKFKAPESRHGNVSLYIRLEVLASCRFNNDTRILTYEMDEGGDPSTLERQSIIIRNEEYSGDCVWEASSDQPWVNVNPTQGTLKAGSQAWVAITVTDGIAAYGPGNHNANIQFRGPLFQPSATSVQIAVIPPPCDLQIDRQDAVVQSIGPTGGPFTPSFVRLTLRNNGGEDCTWNAVPKETWVDINPLAGIIPKGAVSPLEVAINDDANSLLPGRHDGLVTLSIGAQGDDRTVQVHLDVTPLGCDFKVSRDNPLDFKVDSKGVVNNKHTIELSNPSHRRDCVWEAIANPDWLIITPLSGVISPGSNLRVEVSIDAEMLLNLTRKPTYKGMVQFHVQGVEGTTIDVFLEEDCLEDQPCIDLHSTRENIVYGENAELSLSMSNPLSSIDQVTVNLVLTIPDGWSLAPGDYNADCNSGRCSSNHLIRPGEKDEIQILASPNAPSSEERKSTFTGRVEWFYGDQRASDFYEVNFPITVAAASEQIIADFHSARQARPTLAPVPAPAPVIIPTPTLPTPEQTPAEPALASPAPSVQSPLWQRQWFLPAVIGAVIVIVLLLAVFLLFMKWFAREIGRSIVHSARQQSQLPDPPPPPRPLESGS